ncbi:SPL family radical SAM protein [Pyrococcus abyssi]|uniref:Radical SAM family protein n=1 Tax=Pyrococcus abyssi (strain GE5 / Orsay) TaxID=272844 RepID=Q9V128_PYRAB|nr:radical SAM protein [Pyrococcus abyssi]CAB49523.1 Radical SAM family protein [Pyrococcus abyssi GE5]CCE69993.1 TPA: hypothetical protein PAB0414 [Pyrococcus abyssi GE5]
MRNFIIGTSSHISGLCHSIVRGELFTTCSVGCIYCYARWYRGPHGKPKPIFEVFKLIKSLGEVIREGYPVIPIRFSALSDPFQPPAKITLKALKIALRNEVPVVINTKLIPSERHLKVLEDLASNNLAILQVSIPADKDYKEVKVIEPFAPSIEERFKLVEKASSLGIPVIVRVQPLIPGLGDRNVENFVERVAESGAIMVILEFLRIEKELMPLFSKLFGEENYKSWVSYLPLSQEAPLLQPPLEYRIRVAEIFSRESSKFGLYFSTCKEGLYHLHEPKDVDCCGFKFLGNSTRRPTLWDLFLEVYEKGKARGEDLWVRCEREGLLCRDKLKLYPPWLYKGLRMHEKRLESILKKPRLVEKLVPSLTHDEEEEVFYLKANSTRGSGMK